MGVGVGNVAAGKQEGDPLDAIESLLNPRDPLPQRHESMRQARREVVEVRKMRARDDQHMTPANRPNVKKGQ